MQGNIVSQPLDAERCMRYLLDHRTAAERKGGAADDVVLEFPGSKK